MINKLKQTLRSNTNNHELNSKRMREKLIRLENELCVKAEELSKHKSKVNLLKTQVMKSEATEKKLRSLMINKESFI